MRLVAALCCIVAAVNAKLMCGLNYDMMLMDDVYWGFNSILKPGVTPAVAYRWPNDGWIGSMNRRLGIANVTHAFYLCDIEFIRHVAGVCKSRTCDVGLEHI